ncbi:beta-galactosidase [Cellulomonas marina]|uniref:Glycosyl hydrolases family 35 n=1 Tax=Cellulomonas marina TaxID=988821 RepID=A0A1I0X704_9CELL|nr:beta-galactosidase [Cellulomonas marina]GIG29484.1 hypothetical protein Cma02nite_20840 [Cellulomonas marina]SFA96829.1 Glycosyl hydrolases family 35 [Cellulomonas marina]
MGGDAIGVTAGWFTRGGRPWFPVTGEVHYCRVPRERWAEVLGHARAGGLTSVATYVLWQAHEPEPGRFRWDGDRDLRAFVELAGRHGLDVVLRLGPWAHGEARYGGFPDWVVESGVPARTNDPAYLALVRRLYGEVVAQVRGLTHPDGGPVVAAQVDNELYDAPEHLAELRRIAEDLGLRVPLWTATGWGGARLPSTVLPVYSAYVDGFWEEDDVEQPAFAPVHFRYSTVRDDLGVGADVRAALDGTGADGEAPAGGGAPGGATATSPTTPFATCELGGGMHVAYHRRPLVAPRDVAALALAKIGSGSAWQGYYLYAGGTQRTGPHGTEQESQATGYPNDVPTRSYDFHAPVGEHGQVREHHHLLRRQHLWLADDGEALATMGVHIGGGSTEPTELRWSVRSGGGRGYLFLTTYAPAVDPLPAQPGVRLTVPVAGGDDLVVPTRPVDLPAGVSTVWPLRLPLTDDLVLRSATAELLTRIRDDEGPLVVLVAVAGVPVQLVLEGDVRVDPRGPVPATGDEGLVVERGDGVTVVRVRQPGTAPLPAGGTGTLLCLPGVRVLVLDETAANGLYRLPLAGRERLVLADAPVRVEDGRLVVHTSEPEVRLAVLPAPGGLAVAGGDVAVLDEPTTDGPWTTWRLRTDAAGTRPVAADLHPHATAPAPRRGGPAGRLAAPEDLSGAARLPLTLPPEALDGVDRALLRVTWTGDVGRALVDDEVVGDHFWHGRPWDVDLTRHREAVAARGVTLELLPWRRTTGVWVHPSVRDVPDGVHVESVDVVRVARVVLEVGDGRDDEGTDA